MPMGLMYVGGICMCDKISFPNVVISELSELPRIAQWISVKISMRFVVGIKR